MRADPRRCRSRRRPARRRPRRSSASRAADGCPRRPSRPASSGPTVVMLALPVVTAVSVPRRSSRPAPKLERSTSSAAIGAVDAVVVLGDAVPAGRGAAQDRVADGDRRRAAEEDGRRVERLPAEAVGDQRAARDRARGDRADAAGAGGHDDGVADDRGAHGDRRAAAGVADLHAVERRAADRAVRAHERLGVVHAALDAQVAQRLAGRAR